MVVLQYDASLDRPGAVPLRQIAPSLRGRCPGCAAASQTDGYARSVASASGTWPGQASGSRGGAVLGAVMMPARAAARVAPKSSSDWVTARARLAAAQEESRNTPGVTAGRALREGSRFSSHWPVSGSLTAPPVEPRASGKSRWSARYSCCRCASAASATASAARWRSSGKATPWTPTASEISAAVRMGCPVARAFGNATVP